MKEKMNKNLYRESFLDELILRHFIIPSAQELKESKSVKYYTMHKLITYMAENTNIDVNNINTLRLECVMNRIGFQKYRRRENKSGEITNYWAVKINDYLNTSDKWQEYVKGILLEKRWCITANGHTFHLVSFGGTVCRIKTIGKKNWRQVKGLCNCKKCIARSHGNNPDYITAFETIHSNTNKSEPMRVWDPDHINKLISKYFDIVYLLKQREVPKLSVLEIAELVAKKEGIKLDAYFLATISKTLDDDYGMYLKSDNNCISHINYTGLGSTYTIIPKTDQNREIYKENILKDDRNNKYRNQLSNDIDYLKSIYDFRFNIISHEIEWRNKNDENYKLLEKHDVKIILNKAILDCRKISRDNFTIMVGSKYLSPEYYPNVEALIKQRT